MANEEQEPVIQGITFDEQLEIINSLVDCCPEAGLPLEMPFMPEDEPHIDLPVEK